VEDLLVAYVTDRKPLRRLRFGAKTDRFLALGLTIPASLFLLSAARRLALVWPSTTWEDQARLVPAATLALVLLLIGLALATWLRRTRPATGEPLTWFCEQPSIAYEQFADSPDKDLDAEISAA
jgi:hypothetical protein